jgi:hypothetical protein
MGIFRMKSVKFDVGGDCLLIRGSVEVEACRSRIWEMFGRT